MGQNKHTVFGILAHVDAGKTTLSEAILYKSGVIRKAGRVDHKDAFLDTFDMEKQRGITIFSKQAEFARGDHTFTLLDTPGHVDFSPEMERTLQVMDCAVLVISAPEGINGRVRTLWKLLEHYHLPTVIFVNKMDQAGADRQKIFEKMKETFGDGCVDFQADLQSDEAQEEMAVCDEEILASYLEGTPLETEDIRKMIWERHLFPCYFGAGLKMEGVEDLLTGLELYMSAGLQGDQKKTGSVKGTHPFSARVFKISRDPQGTRLTWIRLTEGVLKVKDLIPTGEEEEKIDQIRIYSGSGYDMVQELEAGRIAALTGLAGTGAGQGLGGEKDLTERLMQPVFRSAVLMREGTDRTSVLRALRVLEEEEPLLQVHVNEETQELFVGIMGEVQTEILKNLLKERFSLDVSFGEGSIAYKETIADTVEGVGHFEPLRHYAEVHLLLEPGEPGSGLQFGTDCSTDHLALNWQRLVMTHLEERSWQGVLTGSDLTDVRITLIGGRAHDKHTEGGDFRQATYRAVRQGLMLAKSILLEPVYAYEIRLPSEYLGRAMTDMERMGGTMNPPDTDGEEAVLTGSVPAAGLRGYQTELIAYSGGQGQLTFSLQGYQPCRNAAEIIERMQYDPDADRANPSASVFCSHGAGVPVSWDMVREYMHVDTGWRPGMQRRNGEWLLPDPEGADMIPVRDAYRGGAGREEAEALVKNAVTAQEVREARRQKEEAALTFKEREQRQFAAEKELKEIFERTYGAVRTQSGNYSETLSRAEQTDESVYDQAWRDYRKQKKEAQRDPGGASGNVAGRQTGKRARDKNRKNRCLLVDGYNIIFAWDHLKKLAQDNIDSARDALMDILSDFQGYDGCTLILVFDAYKVRGGERHIFRYHNINIVYTKEAETADAYIEKTVHEISRNYEVTVATSDNLEQMIILGEGASRISAKELEKLVSGARREARETFEAGRGSRSLNRLLDGAPDAVAGELEAIRRGKRE